MKKRCEGSARCVMISSAGFVVFVIIVFLLAIKIDFKPEITGMSIISLTEETVEINFSQEIGAVRKDFYGINDEYLILSNSTYSYLDSDCDGIKDTPVNSSLNGELFTDLNISYVKFWAWLQYISIEENNYNQTIIGWLMDEAEYAHSQGYRILLRTDMMPYWLQNRNSSYCNEINWNSCPPTNNTKFANMISYIVNNLSQVIPEEDVDVEILNEPWDDSWLNNGTNTERVLTYAYMFNTTRNTIKQSHSNISVGWTGTYDSSGIYFYRTEGLISNLTNNTDFIYLHTYPYDYLTTNTLYNNLKNLSDTLDIYEVNPHLKIGFSEWNVWSGTYKYNFERYSAETAFAYQSVLNYNPSNVSLVFFEFSKFESYDNCSSLYPEYPLKFPMFNELDNYIAPTYNITKNFATYHSSGSVIVNSTPASNVDVVASRKEKEYITIINRGENTSLTIKISGNSGDFLKDLETGETYEITNSLVNVGEIEKYGIRYFVNYSEETVQEETPASELDSYYVKKQEENESEIEEKGEIEGREENETGEEKEGELSEKVAGTGSVVSEEAGVPLWEVIAFFLLIAIAADIGTIVYIILNSKQR